MIFQKPVAEQVYSDSLANVSPVSQNAIEETVIRIQSGDEHLRNGFIADHITWVKKVVKRITRSYFVDQMDELSIGLEAFNHAIDHFQTDKQVPFLGFAQLVIERRLIDWQRSQKNERRALLFTDYESPEGTPMAEQLADPVSNHVQADLETQESIDHLNLQLSGFGLSMSRLTRNFPKHRDTRLLCIRIARVLAEDSRLFRKLLSDHRLPVAELSNRCQAPIKTIDRNRQNIIFLALLLNSELDVIKSYIAAFEREGSK